MPVKDWVRDTYLISTDPSIIPLDALNNDIFAADDFHWGRPLPLEHLCTLVQRSLCFALYDVLGSGSGSGSAAGGGYASSGESQHPQHRKLIGFARWITDMVTVNYLTDVYILPAYRGKRLGAWMMECIDEMFRDMPHVRGMILIADWGSSTEEMYRKYLAMDDLQSPSFLMDRKGRGAAA